MWKVVDVNRQPRFIKYEMFEDYHKVYYSDIVNVWMEKLTSSDLSKRCKEMNSLIEAEPEDLARHVSRLIADGELTQITCNESDEARTLQIESQLAGIPFYFSFKLEKMNENVVCKELTIPLMLLALQQEAKIVKLRDMLIAKDTEIEQYKLEGAVLKKKKVETEQYQENVLHEYEDQILQSLEVAKPDILFTKICSLLPVVPTIFSPERIVEMIKSEPEIKPEPTEFFQSPSEVISTNEEESKSNVKHSVKQKTSSNKKQKLRI